MTPKKRLIAFVGSSGVAVAVVARAQNLTPQDLVDWSAALKEAGPYGIVVFVTALFLAVTTLLARHIVKQNEKHLSDINSIRDESERKVYAAHEQNVELLNKQLELLNSMRVKRKDTVP